MTPLRVLRGSVVRAVDTYVNRQVNELAAIGDMVRRAMVRIGRPARPGEGRPQRKDG